VIPAIGRLKRRLRLERVTVAPDGTVTWAPAATVWAAVEPVAGTEREAGGGLAGVATHRVTLRHRTDVTSRDRLAAGARVFRIVATYDPDEARRFLVALVEEEGR
jgi:SPP1 family predicted phage head-tail adaptor